LSAQVTGEATRTREQLSALIGGLDARAAHLPEEAVTPDGRVDVGAIAEWLESDPSTATTMTDLIARRLIGRSIADMPGGALDLLNWGSTYTSPAAQVGLWFNPPVSVGLLPGGRAEVVVNERIVEAPYALAVAGRLPPGSLALDLGAAESTLALSLASLGIDTIALDRRPYPLGHPRLTAVMEKVEDWAGPPRPLDAIFCVSTVEHIGLGHYGTDSAGSDDDRLTMNRLLDWIADEGILVFTAPYGCWQMDNFQRTYDDDHLDALLEGWKVVEKLVYQQTAPSLWELRGADGPTGPEAVGRSVVLLQARPRR
jgi:hypothetical protein